VAVAATAVATIDDDDDDPDIETVAVVTTIRGDLISAGGTIGVDMDVARPLRPMGPLIACKNTGSNRSRARIRSTTVARENRL
jgi:hypothetical protein